MFFLMAGKACSPRYASIRLVISQLTALPTRVLRTSRFYISAQTFSHARRNDGITPRTSVSHVIVSPFGKVYTCYYDEAMTAPMRQAGEY